MFDTDSFGDIPVFAAATAGSDSRRRSGSSVLDGPDSNRRRLVAAQCVEVAMAELASLPPEPAGQPGGCAATIGVTVIMERLRTTAAVEQARSLASLEVVEPRVFDPDAPVRPSREATTAAEVALALRCGTGTARNRLDTAQTLVTQLPLTPEAAGAGLLPWWQVRHVEDETSELAGPVRALVDAEVARLARVGRLASGFRPTLARVILAAAPDQAEVAHSDAMESRAVWPDPRPDGTVTVSAGLPADGADVVLTAIDRLKDTPLAAPPAGWPDEGRTADQRRADALVGLGRAVLDGLAAYSGSSDAAASHAAAVAAVEAVFDRAGRADPGATRRGRRARRGGEVLVTVSAETLLGINSDPGELAGYGPVSAAQARRIALSCDSWRRLLTDPITGAVLNVGRTRYLPTVTIAEHVLLHGNRECSRPGCTRPAAHLDHATPWQDGGTTAVGNLDGLCVGCHRARHTGWTVEVETSGVVTMRTPHGFTATKKPHDHRPEDRPLPRLELPAPDRPPATRPRPAFARVRPLTGLRPPNRREERRAAQTRLANLSLRSSSQPDRGTPSTVPGPLPAAPTETTDWLTEMRDYLASTRSPTPERGERRHSLFVEVARTPTPARRPRAADQPPIPRPGTADDDPPF